MAYTERQLGGTMQVEPIGGVIYQLPRVFRGKRVDLRINPEDPSDAWGTHHSVG